METVRHEDRVKGWSLMPGNGQAETWQSLWKGRGISDGAEVGTDCKIRRIGWMLGRQQWIVAKGFPLGPYPSEGHCSTEGSELWQKSRGPLWWVVSTVPNNGQLPIVTSLAVSFRTVHPDTMPWTGHAPPPPPTPATTMHLHSNESQNRYTRVHKLLEMSIQLLKFFNFI